MVVAPSRLPLQLHGPQGSPTKWPASSRPQLVPVRVRTHMPRVSGSRRSEGYLMKSPGNRAGGTRRNVRQSAAAAQAQLKRACTGAASGKRQQVQLVGAAHRPCCPWAAAQWWGTSSTQTSPPQTRAPRRPAAHTAVEHPGVETRKASCEHMHLQGRPAADAAAQAQGGTPQQQPHPEPHLELGHADVAARQLLRQRIVLRLQGLRRGTKAPRQGGTGSGGTKAAPQSAPA